MNSYSQDALSIKESSLSSIIVDEWDTEADNNYPIAYIKGQSSRIIKITFQHNQNRTQSYTFLMAGSVDSGTGFGDAWPFFCIFP